MVLFVRKYVGMKVWKPWGTLGSKEPAVNLNKVLDRLLGEGPQDGHDEGQPVDPDAVKEGRESAFEPVIT